MCSLGHNVTLDVPPGQNVTLMCPLGHNVTPPQVCSPSHVDPHHPRPHPGHKVSCHNGIVIEWKWIKNRKIIKQIIYTTAVGPWVDLSICQAIIRLFFGPWYTCDLSDRFISNVTWETKQLRIDKRALVFSLHYTDSPVAYISKRKS